MPLDLQIIRANEFVRVGPREHLDFKASKEALRLLAAACRKRGIDRALLDLRNLDIPAKPLFTRAELTALVETFHEVGFEQQQRLAVLYRTDPHQGIRRFAFIGILRGWQVRAFSDFESALAWISEDSQGDEHEPEEKQIPIRVTNRKPKIKPKTATSAKSAN
jgi:hypothetical protein